MSSFIVKQPNGLFCRFSTIVDCPTHINMTADDYIKICQDKATLDAIMTLNRCLCNFEDVINRFVPNNMTQKQFEQLVTKMSDTVNPIYETP